MRTHLPPLGRGNLPGLLLGPTSSWAAQVSTPPRVDCRLGSDPGGDRVAGGATVEVFETAADAKTRSDCILSVLKEMGPAFGTEWHHLKAAVPLRVSGKLSPSVNAQYKAAFGS
jgi:hypothetical protein